MSVEYFGNRLQAARKNAGLTQAELASILRMAKGTISAYEQGHKTPSITVLVKICEILKISSDYLLGISDNLSLEMEFSGLTDEQIEPLQQIISIIEQYNTLKKD